MKLDEMRAALAEVEDYTDHALAELGRVHDRFSTPAELERCHRASAAYIALARTALERFQEAARGR